VATPFIWFDLATTDSGQAAEFYRQLLGWDVADAGVGGYRSWIGAGPQPWAGIVAAAPGAAGRWLPYVLVDDLDQATKRAVSLGATVVRDASDGPAGTSVMIADPGGAELALFRPHPAGS
jgi:predicted enzyme related to lactoylglutathione lyase